MSAVSLYGINGWKVIQSQKDYAPKPSLFTQRLQRAQRRNLIVLIQHLSSKFTQAWSQWKQSKFTALIFKGPTFNQLLQKFGYLDNEVDEKPRVRPWHAARIARDDSSSEEEMIA
mgnify:CR=1 FL=1